MESLEELKKICQGTIHKDVSNVYMRYVCRPLSIRMTRYLLPTSISADQVSQTMIAAGFLAAFVLALPWKGTFLIGALLLQLWYLIDCMDGEVARYRYYQKTGRVSIDKRDASLTGMYYDMINHYLMNFMVPSAVAFGVYFRTNSVLALVAGSAASLGQVLLLAMHDARSRAVLSHLRKYKTVEPIKIAPPPVDEKKVSRSLSHKAFMVLHYTMTYPSVMNLILIAATLAFFTAADMRAFLLAYLTFGSTLVSAALIVWAIHHREPDQELHSQFKFFDE